MKTTPCLPLVAGTLLSAGAALLLVSCASLDAAAPRKSKGATTATAPKLSGAASLSAPQLPDAGKTPGDTLPVTIKDICVPGYSKKVRNVPVSVKRKVYLSYGVSSHRKGEYEIDHLISLQLGGSNRVANLWPQSYETQPWNAHVKDQLENIFHDDVCKGRSDLPAVQKQIASDWIAAYKKRFSTQVPLSKVRAKDDDDDGQEPADVLPPVVAAINATAPANAPRVWVNTSSGAYWLPGTRYYGKTKEGKYLSEAEAIKGGYHAAGKAKE